MSWWKANIVSHVHIEIGDEFFQKWLAGTPWAQSGRQISAYRNPADAMYRPEVRIEGGGLREWDDPRGPRRGDPHWIVVQIGRQVDRLAYRKCFIDGEGRRSHWSEWSAEP